MQRQACCLGTAQVQASQDAAVRGQSACAVDAAETAQDRSLCRDKKAAGSGGRDFAGFVVLKTCMRCSVKGSAAYKSAWVLPKLLNQAGGFNAT